jgi:hypothetical protein
MLTHRDIKKIILDAVRKIDPAIINIRTITQWPWIKVHSIPIDPRFEAELQNSADADRVYVALAAALKEMKLYSQLEYAVTINNMRWIKSIIHYMEQAKQKTPPKIHHSCCPHV